ncbi:prepilin-type N-terminal cleavage/methylation domain-containing protein [Candidatus Sumerlaeota bacterium]|nr:prepilin-type N-terminal cleavage/methylation domain-containing protein [Candidatus Sumerlaeota bacterium]
MPNRSAFTLIELLIVIAIIAILAAIAMMNLLEARTRSRVTRAKAEMRSLATALEAYFTDANAYPPPASNGSGARLWRLSTPVAYFSTPKMSEPFDDQGLFKHPPYGYHGRNELVDIFWNDDGLPGNFNGTPMVYWWLLRSSGPNNDREGGAATSLNQPDSRHDFVNYIYDPTNGTVSFGDLWRYGGEPTGQGADSVGLLNH